MKSAPKKAAKNFVTAEAGSTRLGIQAIARAGAVLRALQRGGKPLSLGELAGMADLPRSTVQRIVDALDREGLVIAATASTGVRLGPALISLAKATQFEIADVMRPAINQLAHSTGETVDLVVMGQSTLVFVEQIEGRHHLRVASPQGIAVPLHCSAAGKALLAALPAAELASVRKHLKLVATTKRTLTNWKELERELVSIRQTGVAFDNEEYNDGVSAISIAFRSPAQDLAAVSILVPTQRFKVEEKKLVLKLQQCLRAAGVTQASP